MRYVLFIEPATMRVSKYNIICHTNDDNYNYYQFSDSIVLYAGEFQVHKAINLRNHKIGPENCSACHSCGVLNGLVIGLCYDCQYNYDSNFNTDDLCECHEKGCVQSLFWDMECGFENCIYRKYENADVLYCNDYAENIIRNIRYTFDVETGMYHKALHKIYLDSKKEKQKYALSMVTRDPMLHGCKYVDDLHSIK